MTVRARSRSASSTSPAWVARANLQIGARFVPVAAGWTQQHPLPIGTAADVGEGLVAQVNSANANVQLSPAAPAGREYFDANVTVTYEGGVSGPQASPNEFGFAAMGSHNFNYERETCPDPGPQPALDFNASLSPGQSTSGYVCWQIYANDSSTLALYFGDGTLDSPGQGEHTVWFGLH